MLEENLVKWLKAVFNLPVYAFTVPQSESGTCWVYENAGRGLHSQYHDGSEIIQRTIKLTKSSTAYEQITDDSKLTKYIRELAKLGDLPILHARISNFTELFDSENDIYERTYTITFKYKE
ncbi:hypothetical protein HLBENOHH_02473 [Aeromonas dhakensis]|uniref:hypothetical protein n=1 Tax=Aeromonas dhakensis TaxID=196024 RepID=UPI0036701E65